MKVQKMVAYISTDYYRITIFQILTHSYNHYTMMRFLEKTLLIIQMISLHETPINIDDVQY
jgi:hypothetical protein